MSGRDDEVVVINLIGLREGVARERFAEFAQAADLPTWRAKDVVLGFDTYAVAADDPSHVDVDFVEVMHLRSLAEWEHVGATDPDIAPLAAAFEELVDETRVRRIVVTPVGSD